MTAVAARPTSSGLRRRRGGASLDEGNQSDSFKAQFFLAVACLWPLLFMIFSGGSGGREERAAALRTGSLQLKETLKNALSRVEIMGYGPTHPRVGVVIVGDDAENIKKSVTSVIRNTDLNRLFCICVVVDGKPEDVTLERELRKIESGSTTAHWHGLKPDKHHGDNPNESAEPHGRKVNVLFNPEKQGVAASRADGVEFLQLLAKKHVEAGIKSPQEDLILLLLESGAELESVKWLGLVTGALIVPPPILGKDEGSANVAMKLANAVSFNTEGAAKRTSLDTTLSPIVVDARATDINRSSGRDYPTPVWNGAALAMRMDTYVNLPLQDLSLKETWPANLDLALNLWLCADGIDMLRDVKAIPNSQLPPKPALTNQMAARFAAVWMDEQSENELHNAMKEKNRLLTQLEWETYLSQGRRSPVIEATGGMQRKCRKFSWFAEEIALMPIANERKQEEGEQDGEDAKPKEQAKQEILPVKPEAQLPPKPQVPPEEPKKNVVPADKAPEGEEKFTPPPRNDLKLPSKPLDQARLDIINKASPILLAKVDVAGGHKEHPHMGARDANGQFGYVHDPTALKRNPPPYQFDNLKQACERHDATYKMLTEKVFVDLKAHDEADKSGRKRDKIFCLVYTIDSGHDRIPFIRQTWGPKCDGFMVGSNKTDESIGAVDIPHEGPEEYNNIWQKVRSMWSYIYDNFYDDYDWFHIGGDDLYLIVENLRLYLESEEIKTAANGGIYLPNGDEQSQTPLFLGRRFAYLGDRNDIFISGGSGYTMNKAALKALVVQGLPTYFPHAHTFSEDTMVARVFRKMGVFPYETKDETGGERYMPFEPGHHLTYQAPSDPSKDWYAKYSIDIKYGLDHCAARSVAFHYIKGDAMKRLHAILYHMCPQEAKAE